MRDESWEEKVGSSKSGKETPRRATRWEGIGRLFLSVFQEDKKNVSGEQATDKALLLAAEKLFLVDACPTSRLFNLHGSATRANALVARSTCNFPTVWGVGYVRGRWLIALSPVLSLALTRFR